MAKLMVVDEQRDTRIPFLRGMLTRSLQNAGLNFEHAYRIASEIRDDLDDLDLITTEELREKIIEVLAEEAPDKILTRYRKEDIYRENLLVTYADGHSEPFSRGIHAQRLESCSLPIDRCNAITRKIHSALIKSKVRNIQVVELVKMTYQAILADLGQEYADYYLVWNDFLHSHRPLIVLIAGVPGTGKSTVATDLSTKLNIVRTQSTDMLREVMRVLIPTRLSPVLHASSFEAGEHLVRSEHVVLDEETTILNGYMHQAEMVEVACNAVIQRAINERVSIIMEGVHIRPSLLKNIPDSDAIVVPVTLGVLDKSRLARHIKGRSHQAKQRRAQRYLDSLDKIWQLQTVLLSEADTADIEIINNLDRYETISEVIKTITQTMAANYKNNLPSLRAAYE